VDHKYKQILQVNCGDGHDNTIIIDFFFVFWNFSTEGGTSKNLESRSENLTQALYDTCPLSSLIKGHIVLRIFFIYTIGPSVLDMLLLLVSLLLSLVVVLSMDVPPPSLAIFKKDLPYIQCQVCEIAMKELYNLAKEEGTSLHHACIHHLNLYVSLSLCCVVCLCCLKVSGINVVKRCFKP